MKDFERQKGYLLIDLDDKDVVVEKSKYKKNQYWVYIDGEPYYFKNEGRNISEVVAYHLATNLGLPAVKYDLAKLGSINGVISKSYEEEDKNYVGMLEILQTYFINDPETIQQMGLLNLGPGCYNHDMTNLTAFWQALELYYKDDKRFDSKKIMDGLLDKFFFNILIHNFDDAAINYVIEESKDDINFVPLFDNANMFTKCEKGMSVDFDKENNDTMERTLEYFLRISDEESVNRFLELYNKCDSNCMNDAIKKTEEQIGTYIQFSDDKFLVANFEYNRKRITKVLTNIGLIENKEK